MSFMFSVILVNKLCNDTFCADVNECLDSNAGCEQDCINTVGSYFCSCKSGFNLNLDMHNCTGILFLNTTQHI